MKSNTMKLFESIQQNLKEGYLVRYFWKDENGYIKRDGDNYDRTPNKEEALKFTTEEEAENAKEDINQFFGGRAKLQIIKESESLKESVSLPEGYETFSEFEVGKNYDPSQSACKLNAMKAYIDDNNEDVYVGSVKVNGEEILHFFNVKGGKVIDHSGTANTEGNEMSEYKGVNISGPLKAKGYTPYIQRLQDASFQNEKGDIIKVVGGGVKPRFFFNDEEVSYEDLKNLNESEETTEDVHANGFCETFEGLNKEVKAAGGLYGFVYNNHDKISEYLLLEIALNAIYELNNDSAVLADLKERYYDYLSEN